MSLSKNRNIRFRLLQLLIVAIAIIFVFISFLVGRLDLEKQQGNQRLKVLSELTTIGNRLEGVVRSTFNLTQGMVHLIRFQGDMSKVQFEALSKMSMLENKYIRNIAFAPNNRVELVYPLAGNEKAIGLEYLKNEEQKGSVIKAMTLQQPVLAGPVHLVQGGIGLINRSPVFLINENDSVSKYWGVISIVAYYDSILCYGGVYSSKDLKIAVQGEDGKGAEGKVFSGDSSLLLQNPVVIDVSIPGGKWRLLAVPINGWGVNSVFHSQYFIFSIILSMLIVAFLTILIYVNQNIHDKNERLALEIGERKKIEIELKKAKEVAEESNRIKTAFLANMSHEIRTPMNAIQGFTEILLKSDVSKEMTREFTEIINTSSKQLLGVINDIIDISIIEAGQLKILTEPVQLNKLMNDILGLHNHSAAKKNIKLILKVALADGSDSITSDGYRLFQVINNLVGNAIKFTHAGFVEFGYSVDGDKIKFFVHDTGIGIPNEFHDLIFERFRQVDNKLSRDFGGTGLGLSICKSIVELMNGKIWVESVPNVGSTFYFVLPYAKSQLGDESMANSHKGLVNLNSKTILIAEDDNLNFLLLKKLIEKTEANIVRASNGREAVDIMESGGRIDLILMDIKMPIMSGYEAVGLIRQKNANIPIIAQTAYAMSEEKRLAMESGCNYYLTKPIDHGELFNLLKEIFK